jgi:hypothetical protein
MMNRLFTPVRGFGRPAGGSAATDAKPAGKAFRKITRRTKSTGITLRATLEDAMPYRPFDPHNLRKATNLES